MERGTELKTKKDLTFYVKNKFPSGQGNYIEDHYELVCSKGFVRLSKSLINYLFENQTEKEMKEELVENVVAEKKIINKKKAIKVKENKNAKK